MTLAAEKLKTAFTFYTTETAEGEAKTILDNIQTKYGFVPNLFGYMAEAPHLIQAYGMLSELLAKTGLTPAQQQIALLAVSTYHNCGFCRVAHQAFGKLNNANPQTLQAIVEGEEILDTQDKALVEMVLTITDKRGWINDDDLQTFFAAGFNKKNVYDLILVVAIKTISNYSNHLSLPEPNEELKAML